MSNDMITENGKIEQLQKFVNIHFFELFIASWILGVIFYTIVGFEAIDELCAGMLLVLFIFYVFKTPEWRINKVLLFILFVFLFYLFYSIQIKSNTIKSIFMDFIIQLKPYLAFFCVYHIAPKFTGWQRKLLKDLSLLIWFCSCFLGVSQLFVRDVLVTVMGHPTVFAATVVSVSLVYLYSSNYTMKDKIIFIVMLSVGLLSGRAKFYGFFACAFVLVFYFGTAKNLKLNLKNIVAFVGMFVAVLLVAWQKIEIYFIQNLGDESTDSLARFALYATSFKIFGDYMPFGFGLGTFATHASRVDYSPIYGEYGIDYIWGLSKSYSAFIADTYYPSLAEFGVVGLVLFVLFWFYIIKKAFSFFMKTNDTRLIIMSLLIIGFLAIENVADATFTSNRGFFMMIFLGLILSEQNVLDNRLQLKS